MTSARQVLFVAITLFCGLSGARAQWVIPLTSAKNLRPYKTVCLFVIDSNDQGISALSSRVLAPKVQREAKRLGIPFVPQGSRGCTLEDRENNQGDLLVLAFVVFWDDNSKVWQAMFWASTQVKLSVDKSQALHPSIIWMETFADSDLPKDTRYWDDLIHGGLTNFYDDWVKAHK